MTGLVRRHARHMMIFLHNSPFDTKEAYVSRHASFQLPHPTSDTAELIHYACEALARAFSGPAYITANAALC